LTIDDASGKITEKLSAVPGILLLAVCGLLLQGYHPGAEDDAVYLAAIKFRLDPALFPHDRQFFLLQLQATLYDRLMAGLVRLLHLPVAVVLLAAQVAAIALLLYGCLRLARRFFATPAAQWCAVAMVVALFQLPVAGTALFLVDPQLHPRTLATALILLAADCILAHRSPWACVLLVVAAGFHPIMAAFGISFCAVLFVVRGFSAQPARAAGFAAAPPLGWLLDKPTPAWQAATGTRRYIYLSRWEWYEWLGAVAPLLLLELARRWAERRQRRALAQVCAALEIYAAFQLGVALLISAVPALQRLLPLQPMRFLHLVYLLGALIAGGVLGELLLKARPLRWAAVFAPLACAMFVFARSLAPATPHVELPGINTGMRSPNAWQQAFAWTAANTPKDAYFALDPGLMALPGEDYHGFRALAGRSTMADAVKDSAVAMQVPRLAPEWQAQVTALNGFENFTAADFARLTRDFGVTWTVLPAGREVGFDCPYKNAAVEVCRLPAVNSP
jgi:hypothetical protein